MVGGEKAFAGEHVDRALGKTGIEGRNTEKKDEEERRKKM